MTIVVDTLDISSQYIMQDIMQTGPYAGGVRGGSVEPPFLAGYMSRLTTGLVQRTMATAIVLLYAHCKASGRASGVARLLGSYFTHERGWV